MARLSLNLTHYDHAINRLHKEVNYALHMGDEILSMFPPIEVSHRCTARIVSAPNTFDSSMKLHKAKETIDIDMLLQTDTTKYKDFLFGINKSLQDKLKMQTWDTIFKTAEATGQTVDGKGRNFWEVYIETLQKIDFMFDEHGRHNYKFYMNSETAKKVMAVPPTEDQIRRAKEVMDAKRELFFAKKRSKPPRRLS